MERLLVVVFVALAVALGAPHADTDSDEATQRTSSRYEDAIDRLMHGEEPEERWLVVKALAKYGGRALKPLTQALGNESDDAVRIMILNTFARMGLEAAPAVPAMHALLDDDSDLLFRQHVVRYMGYIQCAESVSLLEETARDEKQDPQIRSDATCALGKFGPLAQAAVPALVDLLDEPACRDCAIRALEDLTLTRLHPSAFRAVVEDTRLSGADRCIALLILIGPFDGKFSEAKREWVTALAEEDEDPTLKAVAREILRGTFAPEHPEFLALRRLDEPYDSRKDYFARWDILTWNGARRTRVPAIDPFWGELGLDVSRAVEKEPHEWREDGAVFLPWPLPDGWVGQKDEAFARFLDCIPDGELEGLWLWLNRVDLIPGEDKEALIVLRPPGLLPVPELSMLAAKEDGAWQVIATKDESMDPVDIGNRCLLFAVTGGGGSGMDVTEHRWYVLREDGLHEALCYPVKGHVDGWGMPFSREFDAILGPEQDDGHFTLDIEMSATYTIAPGLEPPFKKDELFDCRRMARYRWTEEEGFRLDPEASSLTHEQLIGVWDDDPTRFLVHNVDDLAHLAEHGTLEQRRWLGILLEHCDNVPAAAKLRQLLDPSPMEPNASASGGDSLHAKDAEQSDEELAFEVSGLPVHIVRAEMLTIRVGSQTYQRESVPLCDPLELTRADFDEDGSQDAIVHSWYCPGGGSGGRNWYLFVSSKKRNAWLYELGHDHCRWEFPYERFKNILRRETPFSVLEHASAPPHYAEIPTSLDIDPISVEWRSFTFLFPYVWDGDGFSYRPIPAFHKAVAEHIKQRLITEEPETPSGEFARQMNHRLLEDYRRAASGQSISPEARATSSWTLVTRFDVEQ